MLGAAHIHTTQGTALHILHPVHNAQMQHKCNAYSMHKLQCTYFTRVKQYNILNWFKLMLHNTQILHTSYNDNN